MDKQKIKKNLKKEVKHHKKKRLNLWILQRLWPWLVLRTSMLPCYPFFKKDILEWLEMPLAIRPDTLISQFISKENLLTMIHKCMLCKLVTKNGKIQLVIHNMEKILILLLSIHFIAVYKRKCFISQKPKRIRSSQLLQITKKSKILPIFYGLVVLN